MNHNARAKTIVGRAFPKVLHFPGRRLRVDVSAWHPDLIREVARGLRQVERDARRIAIRSAANAVGAKVPGGHRHPAFQSVMALETLR